MPNTFKVGDRVYVDGYTARGAKKENVHVKGSGTVKEVAFVYLIIMDKPFVDEFGRKRSFFIATTNELSYLKDKEAKIVFYGKGRTVHCKLFSAEGLTAHTQATCNSDDTFDFLTGVQIALQRMLKTQNKELVLPALKTIKFIDFNYKENNKHVKE